MGSRRISKSLKEAEMAKFGPQMIGIFERYAQELIHHLLIWHPLRSGR